MWSPSLMQWRIFMNRKRFYPGIIVHFPCTCTSIGPSFVPFGLHCSRNLFSSAKDFTDYPESHVHIPNDSEVHKLQPNRYIHGSGWVFRAVTAAAIIIIISFWKPTFCEVLNFFSLSSRCSFLAFFSRLKIVQNKICKNVFGHRMQGAQWWFFFKCRLLERVREGKKSLATSSHSIFII